MLRSQLIHARIGFGHRAIAGVTGNPRLLSRQHGGLVLQRFGSHLINFEIETLGTQAITLPRWRIQHHDALFWTDDQMSVATGETLDGSAFGGVNTQNFACFGFGLRRLTDQRASDGASDDCRFHFASP